MRMFFTVAALIFTSVAFSQTERKIANTCGETYTSGSIKLRTSVGEPIVGMLSTTSGSVSQGFFQSKPAAIVVVEPGKEYSFYPNPFKDELQIKGDITKIKQLQLYDAAGRIIMTMAVTSSNINVKNLAAGMYTARLIDNNSTTIYFMKVVKL